MGPGLPFVVENRPDPTPGRGQAIVQVGRCGICGSDLHFSASHDPSAGPTNIDAHAQQFMAALQTFFPQGSVFGHEFSGEVVALGAGIEHLKVGDRIASMAMAGCGHCAHCLAGDPLLCSAMRSVSGGFGEFTCVSERTCIKLPDSLSLADGALIEPLAVGLHSCKVVPMRGGERVLVLGAGPVGLASIFWAKRLGAAKIVASAPSERRASRALAMGADAFVAIGEGAVPVNEVLGGEPDVVFECAGVPGAISQAARSVRRRGTVVVVGSCFSPDPIIPVMVQMKEVRLEFAMAYSLEDFERGAAAMDSGAVEPRSMVTSTVTLDEFPAAFEGLRSRNDQCKVLVDPHSRKA